MSGNKKVRKNKYDKPNKPVNNSTLGGIYIEHMKTNHEFDFLSKISFKIDDKKLVL